MKVEMMHTEDYDEVFGLMKEVFSRAHNRYEDFELNLPKMCHRDEEHMNKHFGIREDGRLVAVLGVYPLPVHIGDRKLMFSTVGNVAVHPDYEGRGFMKAMMKVAMEKLEEIGADASRLGGLRSRYNHYGYELCGTVNAFQLTERNLKPFLDEDIRFGKVTREDEEALDFCDAGYQKGAIAVDRRSDAGYEGIWRSLAAWQNETYLALDGKDRKIGYLNVGEAKNDIAEFWAEDQETLLRMLSAWQKKVEGKLELEVPPYQVDTLRTLYGICEKMTIKSPNHFKILNYDKVADALLKVKGTYAPIPEGAFVLSIRGYGKIRLFSENGTFGVERTEAPENLELDELSASRFLFGPAAPEAVACGNAFTAAVLPLPLSWNLQDRV